MVNEYVPKLQLIQEPDDCAATTDDQVPLEQATHTAAVDEPETEDQVPKLHCEQEVAPEEE